MGIAYCLIRATPETVAALSGRPRAVAEFVYQDPELYDEPKPGLIPRLFRKRRTDLTPVPPRRDGDGISLDKAWHVIHFLLTGESGRAEGALGLIGDDLHPLAELDLGLGRPNVIAPADVVAFADSADALTDEGFFERFVPDQMPTDELYLGDVIARGDYDDMKEYALENFQALRTFARQAAARGEALITYYT